MITQPASRQLSHRNIPSLWQTCYWIVLGLIFAGAAWQRFSRPLDPIADPDTWGYLSPALRKLTGAEFGHTNGRNFLYPGFLYLVLAAFADFRAIGVVQHLLGLATGGIFLVTWRRVRVFVPKSLLNPATHYLIGLIGAAIYLLATDTTQIETQLRPEAVCGFFISLNLYFASQFVAFSFLKPRRPAALIYGIATVFTALLLASLRPNFWFAAMTLTIPAAAFFVQPSWWPEKIALAVSLIVAGLVILWPEHILARKDDASRTFLPTMLFVIHADLIRDQMAVDLKRNVSLPYPREWLDRVYNSLNAEIAKSQKKYPGHYRSLRFDPEYLWFEPSSISAQLTLKFGRDVGGLCAFYDYYYRRIWQHRPLRVLGKIARQLSIYYFPKCPAYSFAKIWPLRDAYQRGITTLELKAYRKVSVSLPAATDFARRIKLLAQNAPVVEQTRLLRIPLGILSVSHLLCLLLALILSAVVFWKRDRWKDLRWLAALVLFGFTYNAASCLEVAVVNSLEVYRYITVQMYATLLTQLLALWLILEFIFQAQSDSACVTRQTVATRESTL